MGNWRRYAAQAFDMELETLSNKLMDTLAKNGKIPYNYIGT